MIVKSGESPRATKQLSAKVCWMDNTPLTASKKYLLQHGKHRVLAKVVSINNKIHTDLSGIEDASELAINEIGTLSLQTNQPIFCDTYADNKSNGAFILIDTQTNHTAGVGFVQ